MKFKIFRLNLLLLISCCSGWLDAQDFGLADSLRGGLRPERNYDVRHYDLRISVDPEKKQIKGSNTISFLPLQDLSEIQIDLFDNMKILSIKSDGGQDLKFRRLHHAVFVSGQFKDQQPNRIQVFYEGAPRVAKNAPWDGGFVWSATSKGKPWIGVACEGIGASLWWPNKDHLSDEPDSMDIRITVPRDLTAISNGKLMAAEKSKRQTTFHWKVSYPINNYNVTLYIGEYISYQEQHVYKSGNRLTLNYHVLAGNETVSKAHFSQVHKVLEAFDHYLGEYPFPRDGYALVEAPYAGMEHQSAIAYGNKYQNGYMGHKLSEGFPYDYIILHESGHEYWGNSVSCRDHAEMWIHESFTTYMENLFVEYFHGMEAGLKYLLGQKSAIRNDKPILGPMNVNFTENTGDIYYKGAWMLHTLRQAIGNDTLWFETLKGFYQAHAYGFANTRDFISFVNEKTQRDFTAFFRQYLYYSKVPKLEYSVTYRENFTQIRYRWNCDEPQFYLPVDFILDGRKIRLEPGQEWKNIEFSRKFNKVEPKTEGLLIDTVKL